MNLLLTSADIEEIYCSMIQTARLKRFQIESININYVFQSLEEEIIYITREDKKKIVFYNDRTVLFIVDEELKKMEKHFSRLYG